MLVIAIGEQYLPRAPNAAYAAARRTGETVLKPRVKEGYCSSFPPVALRMPSLVAILYVSHRPTWRSRARKNVFTECQVPVTRLKSLPPSPSPALPSAVVSPTR
jgi:hypothetical protein